jgi:hypothetical protein
VVEQAFSKPPFKRDADVLDVPVLIPQHTKTDLLAEIDLACSLELAAQDYPVAGEYPLRAFVDSFLVRARFASCGNVNRTSFSCTIVSTFIRLSWWGLTAFNFSPAWIVSFSNCSAPASPIRFRHRVMLDGSIGSQCSKNFIPLKHCQYGFSTQRVCKVQNYHGVPMFCDRIRS